MVENLFFERSGKIHIGRILAGVLLLLILMAINLSQAVAGSQPASNSDTCPLALTFGETVHCSIDVAGETDSFSFSGTAGDQIRVRVVETSGSLSAFQEIIRPDGTSLCGTVVGEMTCLLDGNGNHTILVNDFGGTDVGAYSLYLQRLNSPAGCRGIDFGALPATGSIDEAAANDCFTFMMMAGDRVRGRVVETAGSISAFQEIIRPDGTTFCGTIVGEQTCLADADGTYTILIKDFGGTSTGDYALYIQRLNNPVGCTPITFSGIPTTGAIDVAAETDCFTFNGLPDKHIRVRAIATSGTLAPFKEVMRPDGTTLCSAVVSEMTCELGAEGTYTILVNDHGGTDSGSYQLTLVCLTQPCGPPLPYSAYLPLSLTPE